MAIRRVVPTGVHEWPALYVSLTQHLLAQIASLVPVPVLASPPPPNLHPSSRLLPVLTIVLALSA